MSGRVLYIDAFAGLAGDMLCAALLDLGADLDQLRQELRALPVYGYTLTLSQVYRGPFAARYFLVAPEPLPAEAVSALPAPPEPSPRAHDHGHGHTHGHGHDHGHDHVHGHGHVQLDPWPGQPHRSWADIRAMLQAAPLPPRARARALAVFGRLAIAEAHVHGMDVEAVAFHEVGAVDSIVDIVGACLLLEQLDVDRLVASALPTGSGIIRTEHGLIPLPGPATLELLRGWPVVPGPPGREHVTPTGAALVTALAEHGPMPEMVIRAVGHGAGTRNPADLPNVVRVILGEARAASSPTQVIVLETQMDDLSGEHLPALLEATLEAGALDAFAVPVLMKKGRSGLWVQALAAPAQVDAVERALLRHGSSFGVRRHAADRRVLDRRHVAVQTPWGEVRVKLGSLDGELLHAAPEHEDVRAVARAAGVPQPLVHAAAIRAFDLEKQA